LQGIVLGVCLLVLPNFCAGQIGGSKAAVATCIEADFYLSVDGVFLMDATNAFSELNRH